MYRPYKVSHLFDRYVRSLREIMTQCECSLQQANKSLSEQCPNLQDPWFPTSWLQSGNEKGWTGGSWCQSPFMGFSLLGLRASTDSSAAVQPGFRELFEEELWEALAEAIPLHSGSAFNLGNCPCSLSGVLCIHAGPSHVAHWSEPDPLASTAWLDLTPASVFQDLPAVPRPALPSWFRCCVTCPSGHCPSAPGLAGQHPAPCLSEPNMNLTAVEIRKPSEEDKLV